MKQKIYILGVINTLLILFGALFKMNHWPGAAHMLTIGIATLVLVFLPVALRDHFRTEGNSRNSILYFVTWLTCFVVFTSMLFKILHWPLARYLLSLALPFPYVVFLPVFLVVTAKNKNFDIYNTVFVLFLLSVFSVFSVLLALNVSKERINDSLGLSRNYNKLEMVLNETPPPAHKIPVIKKIDDVLTIVDEYQYLIFKHEKITEEQWNNNPNILKRPEAPQVSSPALLTGEDALLDTSLEASLNNLIREIENHEEYEKLTKAAPAIFDFNERLDGQYAWSYRIFNYNTRSWALIYLDGLETNLKMLRAFLQ